MKRGMDRALRGRFGIRPQAGEADAMTTCTVTGTIAGMSLAGHESVRPTFTPEPQPVAGAEGTTDVPHPITLTSGPGGAVAVNRAPGADRLSLTTKTGPCEAQLTVPETKAAAVADLMDG